jgi:hypothetical protein
MSFISSLLRKFLPVGLLLLYFISLYTLSTSKANWYGGEYDSTFFPSLWLLNLSYLSLFIFGFIKSWELPKNLNKKNFYIILFPLVVCLRVLYPIDQTKLVKDVFAYVNFANDIYQGKNPYAIFYPSYGYPSYGPVFFYISYLVAIVGASIQVFKIIFIIIDFLIAVMLVECTLRLGGKLEEAVKIGFLYALNPVSIIEAAWSPHNDILMAFFLIAAILALKAYKKSTIPATLLSIGVGIKYVAGFSLPVFLREFHNKKQLLIFIGTLIAIITISFSPFLISSPTYILTHLTTRVLTGGNPGDFFGFSFLIAVLVSKLLHLEAIYNIEFYHSLAVFSFYALYFTFFIDYLAKGDKIIRKWYIAIFAIFLIHSLLATFWAFVLIQLRWIYLIFTIPIIIISIINIKNIKKTKDFIEVDAIFISLLIPVFLIQSYAGWYWLWVLPVAYLLRNTRIKIGVIALILISYMFSYAL